MSAGDMTPRAAAAAAPASLHTAAAATRATAALLAVHCALLTAVLCLRTHELHAHFGSAAVKSSRSTRAMVRWLLFHATTGLLQGIMLARPDWFVRGEASCDIYWKAITFLFVWSNVASSMVLLIRAATTNAAKTASERRTYWLVKVLIVAVLPPASILVAVMCDAKVLFAHVCVSRPPALVVTLGMLASALLGGVLCALFVRPVLKTAATMQAKGADNAVQAQQAQRLRGAAMRNLRLSAVQGLSTFAAHMANLVIATRRGVDEDLSYLRMVAVAMYLLDLVVSSTAIMLMTGSWAPASWLRLQRVLGRMTGEEGGTAVVPVVEQMVAPVANTAQSLLTTSVLIGSPKGARSKL